MSRSVHPQRNLITQQNKSSIILDQESQLNNHDVINELDYQKLRNLWESQDRHGVKCKSAYFQFCIEYQPLRVPPYKRFYEQHQQASKLYDLTKVVDQTQRCACCQQPINPGRFKIKCYYQRASNLRYSSKTTYEYYKSFKIVLKLTIPLAIFSFLMTLINFTTKQESSYQIVALGNDYTYNLQQLLSIIKKLKDADRQRRVVRRFLFRQQYRVMKYNERELNDQQKAELPIKKQAFLCFKAIYYPSGQEINEKLKCLQSQIQTSQDVKYDEEFSKKLQRLGIAIVTFDRKEDAELVANKCQRSLFDYFCRPHYLRIGKQKITIKSAPGPQQIIWENLNVKFSVGRFILLWGVTAIFLVLSGIGNWGISNLNSNFALSLFSSILLLLMNKIIKLIMFTLSQEQKHHTQTQFEVSLMFRYLLATFVNTAIVPFIVHFYPSQYFVQGGLINQIMTVFIVIAFVDPFLSFIDIRFLFKYFHKRYIRNQGPDSNLTQQQAQQIFAGVQPRMAAKYADFLLIYLLMMFYLPIFPIGGLMATIGLWLLNFIEMYMFLRHFRKPKFLSDGLLRATILVIFIGIALYLFMNIYFHSQISNASLISSLLIFFILLIIALVLWCVVKHYKLNSRNRFNKCWQFVFKYVYVDMENNTVNHELQNTTMFNYSEEHYIRRNYASFNPATQRKNRITELQYKAQSQNLNEQAKIQTQKQIDNLKKMKYSEYILTNYLHQKEDQQANDALNRLQREAVKKTRVQQEKDFLQEEKVDKDQAIENSYLQQEEQGKDNIKQAKDWTRDDQYQSQTTRPNIQSNIMDNVRNIQSVMNPFVKKPFLNQGSNDELRQSIKKGSAKLPPINSSLKNSGRGIGFIPPPPLTPPPEYGGEQEQKIISKRTDEL